MSSNHMKLRLLNNIELDRVHEILWDLNAMIALLEKRGVLALDADGVDLAWLSEVVNGEIIRRHMDGQL